MRMPSTLVFAVAALFTLGAQGCRLSAPGGSPHREFAFVQMCDPQLGFGDYAGDLRRLREAVEEINRLRPDFVVICGDLVNDPTRASFTDFNATVKALRVRYYCAPGNHDVGNNPTEATLRSYRELMGRDYFSFENKGCVFVVVNAQLWKAPLLGETEKQDAWLKETLQTAAKKGKPIFVVSHYPLFLKEAEEPDEYFNVPREKRSELLALFERSGVVAVLAGHTHKTGMRVWRGIQFVESGTTSRNFDNGPTGFRVWQVGATRPYRHEFIPLPERNR